MTSKKAQPKTEPKRYVATRGVAWRTAEGEVNREAGDGLGDAPAAVLAELLSIGAAKEATNDEE